MRRRGPCPWFGAVEPRTWAARSAGDRPAAACCICLICSGVALLAMFCVAADVGEGQLTMGRGRWEDVGPTNQPHPHSGPLTMACCRISGDMLAAAACICAICRAGRQAGSRKAQGAY